MSGLKALIAGISTILILGLVSQLAVFMASFSYGNLAKTYTILSPYSQLFTYSLIAIAFAIVTFCGGFITAAISRQKIYLYSLSAAVIACGISLWFSVGSDIFTPMVSLYISYGILFSLLGSWVWKKNYTNT
ncbi:MAG: hypothetical protein QM504_00335 [Pseudomonadota bacterium]